MMRRWRLPLIVLVAGAAGVIALLVYIVGYLVLNRTTFGRRVYAIGGNEQAARLTGINVDRTLMLVYTISGLCMGAADYNWP